MTYPAITSFMWAPGSMQDDFDWSTTIDSIDATVTVAEIELSDHSVAFEVDIAYGAGPNVWHDNLYDFNPDMPPITNLAQVNYWLAAYIESMVASMSPPAPGAPGEEPF